MKSFRLILSLIFLFVFPPCDAQIFNGTVVDRRGEAIPNVNIYVGELMQGISTNNKGEFEVRLPEGKYNSTFSHINYKSQSIGFTLPLAAPLRIIMEESIYEMSQVVISGNNEDPAYRIMRKAIASAPYYRDLIAEYTATSYIKGVGRVDKISGAVKMMAGKDIAKAGVKEKQTYVIESVNEIRYKAPATFEEKVISRQGSLPAGLESNMISTQTYNIYDTGDGFSPLTPNAFSQFHFKYMGAKQQNGHYINEIKVTPKRNKMLPSGTIYIVEELWNVSGFDLTIKNPGVGGSTRIRQTYVEVESGFFLPVFFNFDMDISFAGNKGSGNYTASLKYAQYRKNPAVKAPGGDPVASMTVMRSASSEGKQSAKLQKIGTQIEKLSQKEDMTNRDAIKLSGLMQQSADIARRSDTVYGNNLGKYELPTYERKFEVDSMASRRDSAYWAQIRSIPLLAEESQSYIRRDSLKVAEVKKDPADSTGKKKRSKPVRKVLMGGNFHLADSTFRLYYGGIFDISALEFNPVDGFIYGQSIRLSKKATDTTTVYGFSLGMRYAFSRKVFMPDAGFSYTYWPERDATLFAGWSRSSRDFGYGSAKSVSGLTNGINSLFFKNNVLNYYDSQRFFLSHSIDIIHGLRFDLSAMWEERKMLHNTTNYSFFYHRSRDYHSNEPVNPYVSLDPSLLADQTAFVASAGLQYTPGLYYRKRGRYKRISHSDWPTFYLQWVKGIEGVGGSTSDFDLIHAGVRQNMKISAMGRLNYNLSGGKYFNARSMHFADFRHFSVQQPTFLLEEFTPFQLLRTYEPSTNQWYVTGGAGYSTQYLLLKYLPLVRNTLWQENVGVSYLHTPYMKHYTELRYGISSLIGMGVGVFVGFENFKYNSIGLKISLGAR